MWCIGPVGGGVFVWAYCIVLGEAWLADLDRKDKTYRSVRVTAHYRTSSSLCSCFLSLVFSKALLKLSGRLKFGLLHGRTACSIVATAVVARSTRRAVVARDGAALSFGGKELVADALVMCLQDVLWDSLHTKDFNVGPGSVGECIVDLSQVFLVDLIEMDR